MMERAWRRVKGRVGGVGEEQEEEEEEGGGGGGVAVALWSLPLLVTR